MHKHNRVRVVLAAAAFAAVFTISWAAAANDSSPWLNSNLLIQKQAAVTALPNTLNGNIDCYPETIGTCPVWTSYGSSYDGNVKLGDKYYPVESYIDNRQHFIAIPGSSAFMTYTTDAAYGLYFYFNRGFTGSVKLAYNNSQPYYQVLKPPDAKLADQTGRRLAGDPSSISFSQNAKWMTISVPNVAILRVNLETYEVLPFAPGLSYNIGLNPAPKTAISNDGRYAVVASKMASRFELYDLNTCGAIPQSINGPAQCQARNLADLMRQQFPSYSQIDQARFLDSDNLAIYAGSAPALARFTIATAAEPAGINYLALGDSYISGEGAFEYFPGTDTADNLCHLSHLSYPFLIGSNLGFESYHSVACSGATTEDITDASPFYVGQADRKQGVTRAVWDASGQTARALASYLPGYIDQLDFVQTYQPERLTVSVGGNDMGFSKILTKCVMPDPSNNTCYSTYEDRLELVRQINSTVFNNLVKTYSQLKAAGPPGMRVYAIGYPQIAKPGGDCAFNVHLNNDELIFAQQLIDYLDGVIARAAARAGIYYVDMQDALDGHRLCEAGPSQVAMNGFTLGKDRPIYGLGPIGDESYHPNALGHHLLADKIMSLTMGLSAPMPAPNPTAAPPAENGLPILDAPRSGRGVAAIQFDSDISDDLVYKNVPANVVIDGDAHGLSPSAGLRAQLHSEPIELGSFTTDRQGDLSAQINVPVDAPAGFHALHFFGTNINGQPIDIYKYVWVACTADDLDCDGAADSAQDCVGLPAAGQDYDQDGIDDACDGEITLPPNSITPDRNAAIADNKALAPKTAAAVSTAAATPLLSSHVSPVVLSAVTQPASKSVHSAPAPRDSASSDYLLPIAATIFGAVALAIRRRF